MSTAGRVRLSDIRRMLQRCAPDHTWKETDHKIRVTWKGKVYPSLPKGEHGKGDRAEIEKGHVKKRVRYLEIESCAEAVLPILS